MPHRYPGFTDLKGGSKVTAVGFYGASLEPDLDAVINPPHMPVRMHLKHIIWTVPRNPLVRYLMSGTLLNVCVWHVTNPSVFLILAFLLLLGLLGKKCVQGYQGWKNADPETQRAASKAFD